MSHTRQFLTFVFAAIVHLAPVMAADQSITIHGDQGADPSAVATFVTKFEGELHTLDITVEDASVELDVITESPTNGLWQIENTRSNGAKFRLADASAHQNHASSFKFRQKSKGGAGGGSGGGRKTYEAISQQIQIFASYPGEPEKEAPRPTQQGDEYYGIVLPNQPKKPVRIRLVYNRSAYDSFDSSSIQLAIANGLKIVNRPADQGVAEIAAELQPGSEVTFDVVHDSVSVPVLNEPLPITLTLTDQFGAIHEDKVKLLPVDIVPDWDRDGKINRDDRGKVTEGNPWRWWVNDDKDDGDYLADEESDVPGQANGNFSDGSINGVTDLTDFFPIFLDIKHALEALPSGEYSYKMRQADGALNFVEAPDLIPDDDPDFDGAGAFWRSASWAEKYKNLPIQQITASGISLSHSFLDQLKNGRGILLLEYRHSSNAPLELEIWKGSQKHMTIAFHAKVDAVEKMYRHLNLYDATGTESNQLNNTGEPENYPDDKTNDKAFVMIHGYAPRGHGTKNDKIQRGFQSEIFRRLHQAGSKAKYVAVYWDSATGLDYHKAVYQAFKTSPIVAPKLGFLAGNEITVGAHSLGNIVTSNAICYEDFRPENYFLINAASPIESYNPGQSTNGGATVMKTAMTEKEWKPYDERFHSPNWHARFSVNDNRSKLKWKGRFSSINTNTNPFNFYSTGEDVVANPEADDYNVFRIVWKNIAENQDLGRFAWVGQEFIKGGTSIAAGIAFERNHGGWAFNGRNQELRFMVEYNPMDFPGTYRIPFPNTANQRLNNGNINEEHLAQFGLFKRFESPAYDALYAPINDVNKNWTDAAGLIWQNPHTQAQGSALAGQKETQWVILATAMPSVSYAAAANAVENIEGLDMNSQKNGWPNMPHRNQFANDWQHGDFAGIGATYVKNMYKKAIEQGGLNEN